MSALELFNMMYKGAVIFSNEKITGIGNSDCDSDCMDCD